MRETDKRNRDFNDGLVSKYFINWSPFVYEKSDETEVCFRRECKWIPVSSFLPMRICYAACQNVSRVGRESRSVT